MDKVSTWLWSDYKAEETASFYTSLIPGSQITAVTRARSDNPSNKEGDVVTVEFTLAGRSYGLINGGPGFPFTEAASIQVLCDDQAEVDRLWNALSMDPKAEQCGWLKDRYGLSWQIVPRRLPELLTSPDAARAKRESGHVKNEKARYRRFGSGLTRPEWLSNGVAIMPASYTWDVFTSLDGFGSHHGDWGGYWGKQGPELLARRLALFDVSQRMIFGATTFRENVEMLASGELDPWVTRMKNTPATVVSSTLRQPLDWPDATIANGDAVDIIADLKASSALPLRSHGSLSLNRALMAAGLVDRLHVTIFPVITGNTGTPQSSLAPLISTYSWLNTEL